MRLPMSKFVIREVKTGVKFDLKAANGQAVLTSEVYRSRAAALSGIQSVCKNAPLAKVEDRTGEPAAPVTNPKFELYQDRAGRFRFRLKARNGEIIGISEGYGAKGSALNGIESVRKNAAEAEIEE